MRKWWIGYLLALFALLWAKLPGPSAQDEPEPSLKFRARHRDIVGEGAIVEISTKAAKLPWLSKQSTEIKIQKVELRRDGWYPAEEAPLQSQMKVKVTSPGIAELHNLDSKVGKRLLSGTGHHVIESVEEGRSDKPEKMLVEGKGRGIWRILQRK